MRFAGIDAVSCVEERNVVLSDKPFHVIIEPLMNPLPLAVSENAGPPAATLLGEMLVSVTGTAVMVNVAAFDTRPRACAVMDAVPGSAINAAGTVAMICVALTDVMLSAVVFQNSDVPLSKPLPLAVSVNAGPPAMAVEGAMLLMVRLGVIVNGRAAGAA
jgi:hypothetical protein